MSDAEQTSLLGRAIDSRDVQDRLAGHFSSVFS